MFAAEDDVSPAKTLREVLQRRSAYLVDALLALEDALHKVGLALVADGRVKAAGDLLPVLGAVLLLSDHGVPLLNIQEGRLVVLAHQSGDVTDKVRVEVHLLLDLLLVVVDDGAVHAAGGHVLDAKLGDERAARADLLAGDGDEGNVRARLAEIPDRVLGGRVQLVRVGEEGTVNCIMRIRISSVSPRERDRGREMETDRPRGSCGCHPAWAGACRRCRGGWASHREWSRATRAEWRRACPTAS